jgi:hypothetical protein
MSGILQRILLTFSFLVILLSGCNFPTASPTPGANQILTSVAQTAAAQLTLTNQVGTPSPSITQTATLQITKTFTIAPPTKTSAPPPTAVPDQGQFVSETIPDGSDFSPNATFTKTWRIKNIGSATWTTAYSLVFISGDAMGAPASVPFPGTVAPGQTADFSVNFTAPATAGKYKSYWKMRNASNVLFGTGAAGSAFWVEIDVVLPPTNTTAPPTSTSTSTPTNTTTPFTVTSVIANANPASLTVPCGSNVHIIFTATVATNGAGNVNYRWERSDGGLGSNETISFASAGSQTVTTTWDFPAGAVPTGWQKLHILSPNDLQSNTGVFIITCTS